MNVTRQIVIAAMSVSMCPAHSAIVPTAGILDTRVRTAAYEPNEVYRLQGTLGFSIDLVVSPEEQFVGVSGGDLEAVVVSAAQSRLSIKPVLAPFKTNFTVLTNLRAYHIEYLVDERKKDEEPDTFSVQFTYPPKPSVDATDVKIDEALKRAAPVLNTDYWYCGDLSLQPLSASDDGLHTRITFAADSEWPAIYVLHSDGEESLVNVSVDGDTAVVHRTFERVILRRGELVGCIFNRALIQNPRSPHTGTVSPDVQRVLRGTF